MRGIKYRKENRRERERERERERGKRRIMREEGKEREATNLRYVLSRETSV